MARLFLRKTLTGFAPADGPSTETWKRYKLNEVYKSDVVKPRSYRHHCLAFALLSLTFDNQDRYDNFEHFRKAVAIAAGHVEELVTLDGEVLLQPKSISYDALDEVEFTQVSAAMMAVCARLLDVSEPELAAEVSRYADATYGAVAA
ncbi:MAG: DUF1367 family protein [Patescibacteria group bacterium]|nr:DUF1367 family protein [Patescibacteria group bacterium]